MRLALCLLGLAACTTDRRVDEPRAVPTPTPTPAVAPAPGVLDAQFVDVIRTTATGYTKWGRVDETPNVAPTLCAAPLPQHHSTKGAVRMSEADDAPHGKKLYYLVAHKNRKEAETNWKAFGEDPAWKEARDASEKDGKIVEKIERVWLDPTEYSNMK